VVYDVGSIRYRCANGGIITPAEQRSLLNARAEKDSEFESRLTPLIFPTPSMRKNENWLQEDNNPKRRSLCTAWK